MQSSILKPGGSPPEPGGALSLRISATWPPATRAAHACSVSSAAAADAARSKSARPTDATRSSRETLLVTSTNPQGEEPPRSWAGLLLHFGQARDDRHDLLQLSIPHHIVRNAVAFTTCLHLVDDPGRRPDEDRGHLEHPLQRQPIPATLAHEPLGRRPAVLGGNDGREDAQLDLVEAGAGLLAHPSDLLCNGLRQESGCV